ncbi:hypothetical protein [Rhodococcus sp. NCIMB 12038]|uniref:hypothetical protein n=1 Tax=Rhodococcus sp. NCIMB 12038 TaxID=933800 RepID=UPI000B3BF88E|nr:hypothetical protein [Rhodococcus sp. NCIMB 12038]OUS83979.1 hypothetical protein CA951_40550 [Rhodococcus sp. NCIMB 12038]
MARFAQPGDLDGGDVQGLDLRLLVHTQHDRVVSNRLLQCVTPRIFGGGASDAVTTAAWSTVRDRPDRCSSSRPALSTSSYRERQDRRPRDPDLARDLRIRLSLGDKIILARCAEAARTDLDHDL